MSPVDEIEKRLVASGEYERIVSELKTRLRESGWYDEVNDVVLEELSKSSEMPSVEEVNQKVMGQAMKIVPEHVKRELLTELQTFVHSAVKNQ